MTVLLAPPPLSAPGVSEVGLVAGSPADVGRYRRRRCWIAGVTTVAVTLGAASLLVTAGGAVASRSPKLGWEAVAVARALAVPASSVHVTSWKRIDTATGQRYDADVAGVGIVQLDAVTHELDEVVYEDHLVGARGSEVTSAGAALVARHFAEAHMRGFGSLTARPIEHLDHGAFSEYRLVWQAQQAGAWLPTQVAVGVNARTGVIAYFAADRVAVAEPPAARVSAAQARSVALRTAGAAGRVVEADPELGVVVTTAGRQELVWSLRITAAQSAPHVSQSQIVWVDAVTGRARIAAAG